MNQSAKKPATYADLEAVPPHLTAEILFGNLVTHPRPVPRHAVAHSSVGGLVQGPFQFGIGGPGGLIFMNEPELHLGPHTVVPDHAGWHKDRLVGSLDYAWIEVAPDWVCEFLSPSTEKYDRGEKRRIYATYGVDHLWLVDPRVRCLEVFKRQDKNWLLTHTFFDSDEVSAPPFEAITFNLGLLWPFDQPEPTATR
jgi:Putative restriction endonuclease